MSKIRKEMNLNGKTITFYSYKGGVGRTMSLVNIACLMAKEKRKVLLIDWDLEAPGLHTFFRNEDQKSSLGLVDMIIELKTLLESKKNDDIFVEDAFYNEFLEENLDKFTSIGIPKEDSEMKFDLIKAGKFDEQYTNRLNSIDWIELYKSVPSFFRVFASYLEKRYDYILIDSRTGLADTSGICTMLMPQILVLVFALNKQNLNGVVDVAKQCINYRFDSFDHRKLTVLPLPSRIDNENPTDLQNWINRYKDKFESLFEELYLLDECNLENYFNIAKIPYKPTYAYGENIPVLSEGINNDLFISYHYNRFLNIIKNTTYPWELLINLDSLVKEDEIFNFYNCSIELQANINELSLLLEENEQVELAKELKKAAKSLDKIEKNDDRDLVKKKGVLNRVKRTIKDLGDKNSDLYKIIEGMKDGISIAQDIAQKYNDFAQWLGMPQIPKPYFKKDKD